MVDLFNVLINILLALLLGVATSKLIMKDCCPYKMGLLVVVYFLILHHLVLTEYRMNSKQFFKETFMNINSNNNNNNNNNTYAPQLDVPNNTFTKTEEDYYGTKMPIMGPLDGLPWQETVRRVNFLKYKTQYPYKPMTYTDYKTSMDQLLGEDLSGLLKYASIDTKDNKQELSRWYPDSTLNQINARDCTNYVAGHPLSCIQKPTKLNTDDILLETENDKRKEGFQSSGIYKSTQELLEHKMTAPVLFKNAPSSVDTNSTRDISNDLCRNCTVGVCSKGVCGSKLVEEGNNNILDVDGYVRSYLEDNMDPNDINLEKPMNPWTFF